jgi:DnaJ-domain-containing protein 1
MTSSDYYRILGIEHGASINEIKKAYRLKARMYHPDINPSPDAKELFIQATEAYEFLIAHYGMDEYNEEAFRQAMENWRKYRQEMARRRANAYARASYARFQKTRLYKTTRILDGTTIIFATTISVVIVLYTIIGYIYRLRHPLPDAENPTVIVFLVLLSVGMILFVASLVFLRSYIESSKKRRRKAK